jgi:hypothetical protein
MKTTKIYHPKTKELNGTIIELDEKTEYGDSFESNVLGYEDWHETFEEAKNSILSTLNYEYSGKAGIDRANDSRYAESESFACGNW